MEYVIDVQNVKCSGCAANICDNLLKQNEVTAVDVDISNGKVTIQADNLMREQLIEQLTELGYPEK